MLIAKHALLEFHPTEKAPACVGSVRENITFEEKKTIPASTLRAKFLLIKSMRAPVFRVGPVREKVSLEHSAPVETQPSSEQDELKTLAQINRSK